MDYIEEFIKYIIIIKAHFELFRDCFSERNKKIEK